MDEARAGPLYGSFRLALRAATAEEGGAIGDLLTYEHSSQRRERVNAS